MLRVARPLQITATLAVEWQLCFGEGDSAARETDMPKFATVGTIEVAP
jgi:hypothetical protein